MRMIVINRFYWPEEPATAQLLTDLAEALAAAGSEVFVITSHSGDVLVTRKETRRHVCIYRVRSSRGHRVGLIPKAVDFITFHVGAMWRLFRLIRRGDTVIAMTDPPLLGIGAWMITSLRGGRLFHWVQDIYPELAIELAGQRWLAGLKPLRNLAWRRAAGCVTLGTDMAAVIANAGVAREKLFIVPNWPPCGIATPPTEVVAALRAEWGLAGKFVVAYSGNLGRVHDLEPVLELAVILRDEPHIALVFIGAGAQQAALEAKATELRLSNVQFLPPQPRAQLASSLAVGDVHLVTLRPGCEHYVFPSKLYGIAAVSRPVLVIGPCNSELARIVTAHGFGRAFGRSDMSALAGEIRRLAGYPPECLRRGVAAGAFARHHGDSIVAANRWKAVLIPHKLAEVVPLQHIFPG